AVAFDVGVGRGVLLRVADAEPLEVDAEQGDAIDRDRRRDLSEEERQAHRRVAAAIREPRGDANLDLRRRVAVAHDGERHREGIGLAALAEFSDRLKIRAYFSGGDDRDLERVEINAGRQIAVDCDDDLTRRLLRLARGGHRGDEEGGEYALHHGTW